VEEIVLKEAHHRILNAIMVGMSQVGTVSKVLPGIGSPINVFLRNAAVLMFQAGCKEITPQQPKVW